MTIHVSPDSEKCMKDYRDFYSTIARLLNYENDDDLAPLVEYLFKLLEELETAKAELQNIDEQNQILREELARLVEENARIRATNRSNDDSDEGVLSEDTVDSLLM